MGTLRIAACLLVLGLPIAAPAEDHPCPGTTPPSADRVRSIKVALQRRILELDANGESASALSRKLTREYHRIPTDGNAAEQIAVAHRVAGSRVVRRDEALIGVLENAADDLVRDVKDRTVMFDVHVQTAGVGKIRSFERELIRIERRLRRTENARRLRSRLKRLRRTEQRLASAEYQLHLMAPEVVCPQSPEPLPPDPDPAPPPCTGAPFADSDTATLNFISFGSGWGLDFDCFETEWLDPLGDEVSRFAIRLKDIDTGRVVRIELGDPTVGEIPYTVYGPSFKSDLYFVYEGEFQEAGHFASADVTAFDPETGRIALTYYIAHGHWIISSGAIDIADFRTGLPE